MQHRAHAPSTFQRLHACCSAGTYVAALALVACGDDAGSVAEDASMSAPDGSLSMEDAATRDAGDAPDADASGADAASSMEDDASTPTPTQLEITGAWHSNFGYDEDIDSMMFNHSKVISYDNRANYLIAQSPLDDEYTPGEFSKIVWTEIKADSFWYCTVDFGLPTAQAARMTTMRADASDPDEGGCGASDFPWTKLSPR